MIQPSQADPKGDYEKYVAKAMTLIHSPGTSDAIVGMLKGANPVQEVADAVVMIMQRIDAAGHTAGIEVQDMVKAKAAHEIVLLVIELGEAAHKLKLDNDHAMLTLWVAVQDYIKKEIAAGRIDRQKLNVEMQADARTYTPKQRKEIQQSQYKIQQTARKYNNGQGQANQPAQAPQGLIAQGGR